MPNILPASWQAIKRGYSDSFHDDSSCRLWVFVDELLSPFSATCFFCCFFSVIYSFFPSHSIELYRWHFISQYFVESIRSRIYYIICKQPIQALNDIEPNIYHNWIKVMLQHSVMTLSQHCFELLQHCPNIATLCSAKTSPLACVVGIRRG